MRHVRWRDGGKLTQKELKHRGHSLSAGAAGVQLEVSYYEGVPHDADLSTHFLNDPENPVPHVAHKLTMNLEEAEWLLGRLQWAIDETKAIQEKNHAPYSTHVPPPSHTHAKIKRERG